MKAQRRIAFVGFVLFVLVFFAFCTRSKATASESTGAGKVEVSETVETAELLKITDLDSKYRSVYGFTLSAEKGDIYDFLSAAPNEYITIEGGYGDGGTPINNQTATFGLADLYIEYEKGDEYVYEPWNGSGTFFIYLLLNIKDGQDIYVSKNSVSFDTPVTEISFSGNFELLRFMGQQ
jgi:hypothetical protein